MFYNVIETIQKMSNACMCACTVVGCVLHPSEELHTCHWGVPLPSLQDVHHMKVNPKSTSCSLLTLNLSIQPSASQRNECLKPFGRQHVDKHKKQICDSSGPSTDNIHTVKLNTCHYILNLFFLHHVLSFWIYLKNKPRAG